MHLHRWSNWEDVRVRVSDQAHPLLIVVRQVITQQRRCSVCNLVKTRTL